MKYFYTDPLAAAHMSKHFGMAFTLPEHCKHSWNVPGHRVTWGANSEQPYIFNAAGNGIVGLGWCKEIIPLYVHPDSLHLLEGKPGDLYFVEEDGIAIPLDEELCRKWQVRPAGSIILRGGVHFHWPETE